MSIRFWLAHNKFRLCSALVFVLVFSLLAFAPPLSFNADAIAVADDAIFLVLIAFLASVGITLVSDSHTSSLDLIGEAVHDYASSIGETWDNIKTGFQFGVDKLGNILTNNSVLGFFSGFSDWMTRFYGLTDNSSTVLTAPVSIDGVGTLIFTSTSGGSVTSLGSTFSYDSIYHTSSGVDFYATFSASSSLATLRFFKDGLLIGSYAHSGSYNHGNFYTFALNNSDNTQFFVGDVWYSGSTPYIGVYIHSPFDLSLLTSAVPVDTGTISIPVDGTNYDESDGAVIGGVGAWGDSWNDILDKLREWLDSQSDSAVADPSLSIELESQIAEAVETDLLSTDNWPGLIGPLSLHEFSFSSIWHYVTDWLGLYSGTLATVLGISFALPAVSIVYAVIVISLAVWLLRKVT